MRLRPPLARNASRGALAALSLALLSGCQSFRSPASFAQVRAIDLSPDAGELDLYQGATAIACNLSYGTVTSYVPVAPGTSTLTVDLAGSRQVLSSATGKFSGTTQYTVLINNSAAGLQQVILADRVPPVAATAPVVRLVNQAFRTGAMDVYLVGTGRRLASVRPIATNLAAGAATDYLAVPPGIWTAVMLPAGTVLSPRLPVPAGVQTEYLVGSARSLILLDPDPSRQPGVQAIATLDSNTPN